MKPREILNDELEERRADAYADMYEQVSEEFRISYVQEFDNAYRLKYPYRLPHNEVHLETLRRLKAV